VSRTTRLPRAVLCALDGVLRLWDRQAVADLERAYGVEPGTLDAVAFAPERLAPAVRGEVTDTEWRLSVAAALVEELGSTDRAADFVSAWSSPLGSVDDDAVAVLREVRRRGVTVVLVSNATTRLETDLSVLGVRAEVDGVVSSARLGVAKPDPAIYAEGVRVAGVPAEACLFVDDTETNLPPARAAGMAVHHYRGVDGLAEVLEPVLALPPAGGSNGRAAGRVGGGGDARAVDG
jgi:putative hydrolase of the HAD superfamily